jgi:hypothetical protein
MRQEGTFGLPKGEGQKKKKQVVCGKNFGYYGMVMTGTDKSGRR